jgi:catecholate siderophore receptor
VKKRRLRINAMATKADNNGSGAALIKGLAVSITGIGLRNEFVANIYHLGNNNGMNYGLPLDSTNGHIFCQQRPY